MDQYDRIGIHYGITHVVYEIVKLSTERCMEIGLVTEVKSHKIQFGLGNEGFSRFPEIGEDQVIFMEDPVDTADVVVGFRQSLVVVAATAVHATEFLVGPATEDITALEAFSFVRHKI